MSTYTLAPLPRIGITPADSLKLYTVSAGGSYPGQAVTTYQTSAGTAHTNPIVANAAGLFAAIYLEPGQSYKFIVALAASDYTSPLFTQDNIHAVPGAAAGVDITITAGENLAADSAVYISDGSGGKVAGLAYLADADLTYASSDAGTVGMVTGAILSGASGTLRLSGALDVALSLATGTKYYVSATAGAITTTQPSNVRYVGQAETASSIMLAATPSTGSGGLDLLQIEALLG